MSENRMLSGFMNSSNSYSKILSQFYPSYGRLCELMDGWWMVINLLKRLSSHLWRISICCKIFLAKEDRKMIKSRPISRLSTTTWALSKQVIVYVCSFVRSRLCGSAHSANYHHPSAIHQLTQSTIAGIKLAQYFRIWIGAVHEAREHTVLWHQISKVLLHHPSFSDRFFLLLWYGVR